MKKFFTVKNLCLSGIIAALYAGLTILLQAISFGAVQIRVAEAMTLLPLLTPAAVPGLAVGCFIANLLCSAWQDWVFGTLATLIAALLSYRLRKNIFLAALMPVLCNGLIIGPMLYWMYGGSWILNILTVAAGEAAACFLLGVPLIRMLEKNPQLLR
ncbi:MAG: QueT transporter family protein [Clostridiales bacterium]|nr:QueT transporter family protein [Clostridiales bacterium]